MQKLNRAPNLIQCSLSLKSLLSSCLCSSGKQEMVLWNDRAWASGTELNRIENESELKPLSSLSFSR